MLTFEQCKTLGELLARVVSERLPEIATTVRLPKDRGGRVYVDYLQNGHGKLLAAPFSARPGPAALVSTPLHWHEVGKAERLAPVLQEKADLPKALARLAAMLGGGS